MVQLSMKNTWKIWARSVSAVTKNMIPQLLPVLLLRSHSCHTVLQKGGVKREISF